MSQCIARGVVEAVQSRLLHTGISLGVLQKLFAICLVFWPSVVQADGLTQSTEDLPKFEIKNPVRLESRFPGVWLGVIKGPPLLAGTESLVTVSVVNDVGFDLRVTGGETTCGCTRATMVADDWKSGKESTLQLQVKTPASAKDPRFDTGMKFTAETSDGPVTINLRFECKLNGMLCFKNRMHALTLENEDGAQSFELPFVSTVPRPDFELDFDGKPIFENTAIKGEGDERTLILTVDPKIIPEIGFFGKLTIRDKNSAREDTADLIFDRPKQVIISPHTIRFARVGEGEGLTAQAFVRFTAPAEDLKEASVIEAFVGGKRVSVKPIKLNSRVYRVRLTFAPPNSDSGKSANVDIHNAVDINWRIRHGQKSFSHSSPFIVVSSQFPKSESTRR